jgi:hypothetical protein
MSASGVADPATFSAADAMQAAYFRAFLNEERRQLIADMAKRRAGLTVAGQPSSIGRLRDQIRAVQAELRHVDKLLERLDGRFADVDVAAAP